jgi:hypothetical protein
VRGVWHVGDCGGGGGAAGVIGIAAVLGGVYLTCRAIAGIPWWVWAAVTVVLVAAIAGSVTLVALLWRHQAQRGAQVHAVFEAARQRQAAAITGPRAAIPARPVAALPPVEQHLHIHVATAAEAALILAERNRHSE